MLLLFEDYIDFKNKNFEKLVEEMKEPKSQLQNCLVIQEPMNEHESIPICWLKKFLI